MLRFKMGNKHQIFFVFFSKQLGYFFVFNPESSSHFELTKNTVIWRMLNPSLVDDKVWLVPSNLAEAFNDVKTNRNSRHFTLIF